MGVWGEGPFDNDAAGDMVAGLTKYVSDVVDAKTDDRARDHYYEARFAIEFIVLAHGTDILGGAPLQNTIKALVRMRNDREWLSEWKSPRRIAKALEAQIERVYEIIVNCKRCRKSGAIAAVETILVDPFAKIPKSARPKPGRKSKKRRAAPRRRRR